MQKSKLLELKSRITNVEATVAQPLNIAAWQKRDVIFSALIFFVSFFYQEKKESHLHTAAVKKKMQQPGRSIFITGIAAEEFIRKKEGKRLRSSQNLATNSN